MSKKFIKKKEDFICEKCTVSVKGNGYTNHCPKCLWSKHVDIFPGDRLANCSGLMEPIKVESIKGKYRVTHECVKCKNTKINNLSVDDDMDVAVLITRALSKKFST